MRFADMITCAPLAEAPRLQSGEIVLRQHVLADFDLFWAYSNSARAKYTGNPDTLNMQWYGMSAEIASWPLRGFGGWGIEVDGQTAGQVAITQDPSYPEVELGWTLFDGFEGKSIAYRAAQMALNWAWTKTPLTTLVSYIEPENVRSIALAERLGAVHDQTAKHLCEGDLVYRHRRPA